MKREIKTFDRGSETLVVDTTSGERVVRRVPKGVAARGPGVVRRAMNFAGSAAKHVAKGVPQASGEQVAERWAICQSNRCGLFRQAGNGRGQCLHKSCGCSLSDVGLTGLNKLRWADSVCPVGLWQAVTPP